MITVYEDGTRCVTYCDSTYYDLAEFSSNKNIILLSGGIDSQSLISYFTINNISFIAYFFDYGINKYDKDYAIKFKTNVLKFNLDDLYFNKEIHKYYSKFCECTSPQLAVHIYGIDCLFKKYPDYNIIMPGMPLFFNLNDDNSIANSLPDFTQLSYLRYKEKTNSKLYPYFWAESKQGQEMLNSATQLNFSITDYQKKILLYRELNLDISPQEIKKTGFEEYKDYLKKEKLIDYNKEFRRPISKEKKCIGVFEDSLMSAKLKNYINDWKA